MADFKSVIDSKGLTQAQAARLLGVHRSNVGRWISGETKCPKWAFELIEFKTSGAKKQ